MTKPADIQSIEKTTNKSWQERIDELDEDGARKLTHKELANWLNGKLKGTIENYSWWAQTITVAYEQHIGKRIPGQLADGLFELAVSKTISVFRDSLFTNVYTWFESQEKLNNLVPIKKRSSETPKRSKWRCDFEDGSKLAITVEGNDDKSKLIISHTSVPNKHKSDESKTYWENIAALVSK